MARLSLVRLLSLIGAAVVTALTVHADEYSWQLSGVTRRAETPGSGRDLDTDSWAVAATYYMNPIDDGDGPFALASFLNPTTHLSAEASKTDLPFELLDDPTAYTLNGAYVLPGQKWYVGADYAKAGSDDTAFFSRYDSEGYGVEAGLYVGANTTLEVDLGRSEQSWVTDPSCPPTFCLGPQTDLFATTSSVGFEVFHVRRFRSLIYSLQASVSESEFDTDIRSPLTSLTLESEDGPPLRTYSVAGELFPTKALGVRVGYTQLESEGYRGDSYDVAATWYFKPRIAIQLGLSRESVLLGSDDTESAAIRFIGRL